MGHLVLPGMLWPVLCTGVLDQEVQWIGQDTKRIWPREHSLSVDAEWKLALQGCWTMGKCTGRSSSIAWDWPWLVCVGALH